MRALLAAFVLLGTAAWSGPTAPGRRQPTEERSLTSKELKRYAEPYFGAIRECYYEHGKPSPRANGEVSLHVMIHRDGYVHDLDVEAPGVTGDRLDRLTTCIRKTVRTWHFPVRIDYTEAVIPYYFMHIDGHGAGPQYSCWNPRGCPNVTSRSPVASKKAPPGGR